MRRLLCLLAMGLIGLGLTGCVSTTTTTYGPPGMTGAPAPQPGRQPA
jgi:hypothetical protein